LSSVSQSLNSDKLHVVMLVLFSGHPNLLRPRVGGVTWRKREGV